MVLGSALLQCSPTAQALLEFNRAAIGAGQWWRLLTGNFVHYDWLHLAANVGAFAILAWFAIERSQGAIPLVGLFGVAVGVGVYVWADGILTYRGVSGVDCAVLAWLLVRIAAQERGWKATAWTGALLLMVAKSAYELAAGQVLLPTSAPPGVEVVNVTHVIGLAMGTLMGVAGAVCTASPARFADGVYTGPSE